MVKKKIVPYAMSLKTIVTLSKSGTYKLYIHQHLGKFQENYSVEKLDIYDGYPYLIPNEVLGNQRLRN